MNINEKHKLFSLFLIEHKVDPKVIDHFNELFKDEYSLIKSKLCFKYKYEVKDFLLSVLELTKGTIIDSSHEFYSFILDIFMLSRWFSGYEPTRFKFCKKTTERLTLYFETKNKTWHNISMSEVLAFL
jgi:hypothetical protein